MNRHLRSSDLVSRRHRMRFGAEIEAGATRFRLWAPRHARIGLKLEGEAAPRAMRALADGWHELTVEGAGEGTLYRFILPDGLAVPDPAARFQPSDVHGPSEVIDPDAFAWRDLAWRGRPWEECVLYELHVGAFTPEGTFRAAIERLDHLVELGVTAIELMPVADFPGTRNWGYDGVLLFAPDASYGRPEDLKALVDAAHARGLMVMLDVVYNHFGPDGNYLAAYAPIFTERHHTPWGAAVNFDADGSQVVREFFIENALYWIEEFHLDGIRFDAVHAIVDDTTPHILEEIAARVWAASAGRHVHLMLENAANHASRLVRDELAQPRHFTAQWNDDFHHVLHVAATGESDGYYADFAGDTEKLGRALAEGFAYQGEPYGKGYRGEPSAGLPPTAFVSFIQNHDQIGNRAFGERLSEVAPREAMRAVVAIMLLSPQIPLLFMGEEWAASAPFPFFCDFASADLSEAIRSGRLAEFAHFAKFQDKALLATIPDATALGTFSSAKLDWSEAQAGDHADWLAFYRRLLAVRHAEIVPRLAQIGGHSGSYRVLGVAAVHVAWRMGDGSRLLLAANLKARPLDHDAAAAGRLIWTEGLAGARQLGPWSVRFTLESEGRGDAG